MSQYNLIISILKKETKIVVFSITDKNKIDIYDVQLINKFISKNKALKVIKKISKKFTLNKTVISVYNDCSNDILNHINITLLFIKLKKYKIVNELFVINEALKAVDESSLKDLDTKLKYIKNGYLDFSKIEHIDLNGLVYSVVNNKV